MVFVAQLALAKPLVDAAMTLMALDDGDRLVTVVKVAHTPVVGDEDEGEDDAGV